MSISGRCVLAIIAHPDDETRFSGTLAKLVRQGNRVTIVIATNGDKGTHDPAVTPEQIAEIRRQEMEEAAAVLGVSVDWLGFSDGTLDATPDLKERVFRVVREYRPDILITFDPFKKYDVHSDHITIGKVSSEAAYLADGCWYFPEHLQEGLQPHKTKEVYLFNPEVANYTVDIRETIGLKAQAAEKHRSQFGGQSFADMEKAMIRAFGGADEDYYVEKFHKMYRTDLLI